MSLSFLYTNEKGAMTFKINLGKVHDRINGLREFWVTF